jgi:hypothetical protein
MEHYIAICAKGVRLEIGAKPKCTTSEIGAHLFYNLSWRHTILKINPMVPNHSELTHTERALNNMELPF